MTTPTTPRPSMYRFGTFMCLFFVALPAFAASFTVKPIQVHLAAGSSTTLLMLSNESDETMRFQIKAHAWTQSVEGQVQLAPTQDIVFFPSLLVLEPKQQRNVRIGVNVPPGTAEKTYRLLITELPKPKKPDSPGTFLTMLTEMSVPIFFYPAEKKEDVKIEIKSVAGSRLAFAIHNTGNVHISLQKVAVKGLDADGKTVFENSPEAWYVLPASRRDYVVEMASGACSRVRSITIETQSEERAYSAKQAVAGNACGS